MVQRRSYVSFANAMLLVGCALLISTQCSAFLGRWDGKNGMPTRNAYRNSILQRSIAINPLPDPEFMKASEMRRELESYGINTASFLERFSFVEALEQARREFFPHFEPPTRATKRSERVEEEIAKARRLRVTRLKKELDVLGISTKSFYEKSEFVRAVAEARVDAEVRLEEEAARLELEARMAAEAEALRQEEARIKEEARKADEARKKEEELLRKEMRMKEEAAKREEQRRKDEARKKEEERMKREARKDPFKNPFWSPHEVSAEDFAPGAFHGEQVRTQAEPIPNGWDHPYQHAYQGVDEASGNDWYEQYRTAEEGWHGAYQRTVQEPGGWHHRRDQYDPTYHDVHVEKYDPGPLGVCGKVIDLSPIDDNES